MSTTIAERIEQAQTELAVSMSMGMTAVRDTRIPEFERPLLGGYTPDFAPHVVACLAAIKKLGPGTEVCTAVISAMAIGFAPRTLSAAASKVTPPNTAGVPVVTTFGRSQPEINIRLGGRDYDVADHVGPLTDEPAPTPGDAAAMLAMAVFAAGKTPTDDNKDGFLGGSTRGRVGALKEQMTASDLYLTGARSLKLKDLKTIHRSFAADPAARHALFSSVALTLARPLTICETAVQGQARLLRGEGHGSFERALHAVATYGGALDKYPMFRTEMFNLRTVIATLKAESYTMRTYGYILDRDAYDTLRVSKYEHLAQLGLLQLQEASPSGSIMRVQNPVRDATKLAAVKLAYQELSAL